MEELGEGVDVVAMAFVQEGIKEASDQKGVVKIEKRVGSRDLEGEWKRGREELE